MKYSLIIDTGTSSMRGVLFDEKHRIAYIIQRKYFMALSGDDSAEQNAEVYQNCLEEILSGCGEFAGNHEGQIFRIALTSQRSSVVAVNRSGKPLGPVMMWYDKRPQAICDYLNKRYGDEIYATTGMHARPMFSAPKMLWMKRNREDIYRKAYKLAGIQDYLIFLLTGEWVTDVTFASRTNLLDLERRQWSERMLKIFEIDVAKLCRLIEPGEKAGVLQEHFMQRGFSEYTEVFSAGGDQQCSAVGQGLFGCGKIGITNGTASYVAVCSKDRMVDQRQRIHVNCGAVEGSWLMEASNMGTGSVYDWIRNQLYEEGNAEESIEKINQALKTSSIGSGGVVVFPYLAGKGMPDWDAAKSGCILNLKLSTGKADIARAFLEGIIFEVCDCYRNMEAVVGIPDVLQVSGGLSRLPLFNQMLADMLDRKIESVSCKETTAIGAYIVILLACGELHENEIESILIRETAAVYQPDNTAVKQYCEMRKKRRELEESISFEALAAD